MSRRPARRARRVSGRRRLSIRSRQRTFLRSPAPSQGRDVPPDALNAGNASCPELPCVHAMDRQSVHRRPGARVPKTPSVRPQVLRGFARRLFNSRCSRPRRAGPPQLPTVPSAGAKAEQPRRAPVPGRPRARATLLHLHSPPRSCPSCPLPCPGRAHAGAGSPAAGADRRRRGRSPEPPRPLPTNEVDP
jgi:hypothetical protein